MKIAYLINQYPKVSHSFIRREILALEAQGFDVQRIAVRGWDAELVDQVDIQEQAKTHYVLQSGLLSLLLASLAAFFSHPLVFLRALRLTLSMARRAERPWPVHLIYLAEACRILPWLRQSSAKHVHAHFGTNPAEVAMLIRALGGPSYSFTVHGPEEFDKPEFLHIAEKIKHSAFVVAISSFGRSQLFRWIGYREWPKVKIVHCGLEQSFHNVPVTTIPEVPQLVCVGRLCEQKGQLLLVNAVHQLVKKGLKLKLVLAGDGEMRQEIESLVEEYQLHQVIRITGWISSDQVRDEILASRALVLPSFAEGLPVVIMEAMALRRPVLTTFVAGIPELVKHGENGWLFPAGDVDTCAAAIEDFLQTPATTLEAMGNAAHDRVLLRHSIDIEAAKLANFIQDAVRSSTSP